MNTQLNTDNILADLENFIDELPVTRRRKRTLDVDVDTEPELENYGIDPAAVSIRVELTHEDQVHLHLLLWELSRGRGETAAAAIRTQIRDLLGLSLDLPSYEAALTRRYDAAQAQRKNGAQ